MEQTDWRIKFEKKQTELTEKEERQMRRTTGERRRRGGKEAGKRETQIKRQEKTKPSQNSYIRHIDTQITQIIHINTDREQHTHKQK